MDATSIFWDDPWATDKQGNYITTPKNNTVNLVRDLIDFDKVKWKHELLIETFNERDVNSILAIPLSLRYPRDCLSGFYQMTGPTQLNLPTCLANHVTSTMIIVLGRTYGT